MSENSMHQIHKKSIENTKIVIAIAYCVSLMVLRDIYM